MPRKKYRETLGIAHVLRNMRIERGYTQKDVARLLHNRWSEAQLSRLETGTKPLKAEILRALILLYSTTDREIRRRLR